VTGELRGDGEGAQIRTDRLRDVIAHAGWRTVDPAEWKELEEFLFARVIGRHGGRIWADGRVGHGAMFFFATAPDP
jgi:hypothetical protein